MNKEQVINKVDEAGILIFSYWYKDKLHYENDTYKVVISPEYRDLCEKQETLWQLLSCEDYKYVRVYKSGEVIFYKKGDKS